VPLGGSDASTEAPAINAGASAASKVVDTGANLRLGLNAHPRPVGPVGAFPAWALVADPFTLLVDPSAVAWFAAAGSTAVVAASGAI
jgi:hypothetical protein